MSQETQNQDTMHTPDGYTNVPTRNGPILGILIIVLVIIFGGLYLWGTMLTSQDNDGQTVIENNEPETPRAQTDIEILNTMSPSDELDAIEADLANTDVESLNPDLDALDIEITMLFAE